MKALCQVRHLLDVRDDFAKNRYARPCKLPREYEINKEFTALHKVVLSTCNINIIFLKNIHAQ